MARASSLLLVFFCPLLVLGQGDLPTVALIIGGYDNLLSGGPVR